MVQGRSQFKTRKTCAVNKHAEVRVVSEQPLLYRCEVCEHYLGDVKGLTNYGPDRPVLV